METVYVGLDLGSSSFQQVALNHNGVSRVNREFTTNEANLVKAFWDLKGEIHVHLEAGQSTRPVREKYGCRRSRAPGCGRELSFSSGNWSNYNCCDEKLSERCCKRAAVMRPVSCCCRSRR